MKTTTEKIREKYKLTREQFKAQFPHRINSGGLACNPSSLVFSETRYGYRIYRLLNKLVLEDENGELYISSID